MPLRPCEGGSEVSRRSVRGNGITPREAQKQSFWWSFFQKAPAVWARSPRNGVFFSPSLFFCACLVKRKGVKQIAQFKRRGTAPAVLVVRIVRRFFLCVKRPQEKSFAKKRNAASSGAARTRDLFEKRSIKNFCEGRPTFLRLFPSGGCKSSEKPI